ncbi:TrkA-N domain-containing protein [Thermincola ferriacetica]|uniref:TrkA-N domain protein n=2 Tax=Thermincola TaxID=278993 RepID=D5X802_THEPJ|nr:MULTISPECIES: TrkA family potassium uptake protein [Thermincola]ADG82722.1 TrkA-N domain protein [Thermincola potens JR]KNZ70187.1 TrkA-N domain-containing protein [Thermincola ferriacetica]
MKQFAVIGLGRFGSSVAKTLYNMGHDVLAIDSDEERIEEMVDSVTHCVQADALDEDALKALGIRNFEVVIVAIGKDIQASILVTVMLKEMGVKCVVVKAQNDLHGKVLAKIGADKIVYPERDMGAKVAHSLVSSNVLDHIELSPVHSILEVVAPDFLVGKSLRQSELRARYEVTIMAIKRDGDILVAPQPDEVIRENDILVAIGKNEKLRRLERE